MQCFLPFVLYLESAWEANGPQECHLRWNTGLLICAERHPACYKVVLRGDSFFLRWFSNMCIHFFKDTPILDGALCFGPAWCRLCWFCGSVAVFQKARSGWRGRSI